MEDKHRQLVVEAAYKVEDQKKLNKDGKGKKAGKKEKGEHRDNDTLMKSDGQRNSKNEGGSQIYDNFGGMGVDDNIIQDGSDDLQDAARTPNATSQDGANSLANLDDLNMDQDIDGNNDVPGDVIKKRKKSKKDKKQKKSKSGNQEDQAARKERKRLRKLQRE